MINFLGELVIIADLSAVIDVAGTCTALQYNIAEMHLEAVSDICVNRYFEYFVRYSSTIGKCIASVCILCEIRDVNLYTVTVFDCGRCCSTDSFQNFINCQVLSGFVKYVPFRCISAAEDLRINRYRPVDYLVGHISFTSLIENRLFDICIGSIVGVCVYLFIVH